MFIKFYAMEINEGASSSKDSDKMNFVKDDDILPGCSSFDDFLQTAYPFVMKSVKYSNCLPVDRQFSYYGTFLEFKKTMEAENLRIENMMQKLLTYCGSKRSLSSQTAENKFDVIIDTNDLLLERVSKCLNEIDTSGRNSVALGNEFGEGKHAVNISGPWNRNHLSNSNRKYNYHDISNRQESQNSQAKFAKPQTFFKEEIDNSNETWVPKIKEKPNALKPLSVLLTRDEKNVECYTHPYDYELTLFKVEEKMLQPIPDPKFPNNTQKTPLVMVYTESHLDELIGDLLRQKEIAVDLEHHSFRSFLGITCLLQISTREKDYLVDTLTLRHALHKLNEVFTKPSILKIFHGADADITWLQRDFGIYVVNMFDTYQAAKVLNYPKLGLSYLLNYFCNVETDKRYQLFDWRVRPLPARAQEYARTDTHYLIYIYEKLNNELIGQAGGQTNLLTVVYQRSTETCRRIYYKPILTEGSYMTLYRRSSRRLFDSRQLYALREIYNWRDKIAREEDESPGYILSNHMMMQICQTLPREMQGILACCNPVPPAVRQHLLTLHKIVLKAKDQPLVMPLVEESAKPSSQFSASRDFDIEAKVSTYIHDNAGLEFRDDYPTLLGQQSDEMKNMSAIGQDKYELNELSPKLNIMVNTLNEFIDLDGRGTRNIGEIDEISHKMEKVKFVTPYERYKQVLPYSRKIEEQEREKQRIEEERNQERLLSTQYNDHPHTSHTSNQPAKENNAQNHEKENILKRPLEVKAEPLSSDNPGKKRRMLQKFDVCEPREEGSEIEFLSDVKKETRERNTIDEGTNEGSVGVVGGEVSVVNKRTGYASASKHKKKHQDFTPYDYRKVDFNKFQSSGSPANRVTVPDSKFKGKVKKNRQFQGKHNYSNRKGGRKF